MKKQQRNNSFLLLFPSHLQAKAENDACDYSLREHSQLAHMLIRCHFIANSPTSSPGVPFVMRWKSGLLAMSNDILVLNGFVNTID